MSVNFFLLFFSFLTEIIYQSLNLDLFRMLQIMQQKRCGNFLVSLLGFLRREEADVPTQKPCTSGYCLKLLDSLKRWLISPVSWLFPSLILVDRQMWKRTSLQKEVVSKPSWFYTVNLYLASFGGCCPVSRALVLILVICSPFCVGLFLSVSLSYCKVFLSN